MSTISASTTNTTAYKVTADTTGALVLQTGSGPTTAVTVDTSQNVGIGTSSPGGKLDVTGSAGTFRVGTAGDSVSFTKAGTNYISTSTSGGQIMFQTGAASNAMLLDSSGNVGIGTSSPTEKLMVAGSIRVTSNANDFNVLGGQFDFATDATRISAYNSTGGIIQFFNNASGASVLERGRFASNGNFLVGTTTSPTQTGAIAANNELFVYNMPTTASGANCTISSGESNRFYRSTSALKYKQDIRDIELIDISKFRPVRYKSKCENDDQTKDHFGIIADEVHEAGITELVSYGIDGEIEGFQYDRLTVVLLKTIQEQQAIITQLQSDVAALKGQA